MKESVILYTWQYDSIKDLSLEDKGLLFDAIFHYAKTGEGQGQLSPVTKIAFSFIRNTMDYDSEKYQKRCEKNQENIRKRWNDLNKGDTNVYDRIPKIQTNTKRTDIDNDNDNDIDIDIIPSISPKLFPDEKKEKKKKPEKEEFIPPPLEEVLKLAKELYPHIPDIENMTRLFFHHYDSQGWKKGTGVPITKWESALSKWVNENVSRNGKDKQSNGPGEKPKPKYGER